MTNQQDPHRTCSVLSQVTPWAVWGDQACSGTLREACGLGMAGAGPSFFSCPPPAPPYSPLALHPVLREAEGQVSPSQLPPLQGRARLR